MDPDYLPFHPTPSKPVFKPPPGAVDAHCHVFGPADRFPYAPERKYTPSDAPKESLFALHKHLGFERSVIVQATCHGKDNTALVDALESADDKARGVASVGPDISEAELQTLHEAGVRAVRFNFVKRLVDATPKEVFLAIAEKIKPLGWNTDIYFEAQDLEELIPFIRQLPTPIVVDHMGRPDVTKGIDHQDFQRFLGLVEERGDIWVKVTCPDRLTVAGPPYDDVVAHGAAVIERFPDRVIWGTDWAHPNMKSHMPDDGALVDHIPRIAPTPDLQQALLVDNPTALYWP